MRFASDPAAMLRSSPPGPPGYFRFDINALTTRLPAAVGGAAPSAASASSSPSSARHPAQAPAAAAAPVPSASGAAEPGVEDGGGGESDEGEIEAEGAGLASSLAEVLALVADEDDISPETLAELRCEMRPRAAPTPRRTATSPNDAPTSMLTPALGC